MDSWEELAANSGRYECVVYEYNNKIYELGGFAGAVQNHSTSSSSSTSRRQLVSYDIATDTWTYEGLGAYSFITPSTPPAIRGSNVYFWTSQYTTSFMQMPAGTLTTFTFGPASNPGTAYPWLIDHDGDFWINSQGDYQNVSENSGWLLYSGDTEHGNLIGITAATVNGVHYVAGGWSSATGYTNLFATLDLGTGELTALDPMPRERARGSLVPVADRFLYMVGGRDVDGAPQLPIDRYDTATGEWEANFLPPLPYTPGDGYNVQALAHNGYLYAIGNEDSDDFYRIEVVPSMEATATGSAAVYTEKSLVTEAVGSAAPTGILDAVYDPENPTVLASTGILADDEGAPG